jgi:hypothetical protein
VGNLFLNPFGAKLIDGAVINAFMHFAVIDGISFMGRYTVGDGPCLGKGLLGSAAGLEELGKGGGVFFRGGGLVTRGGIMCYGGGDLAPFVGGPVDPGGGWHICGMTWQWK